MRPFYNAAGNRHYAVDEDMRRQLEAKLTAATVRRIFKRLPLPGNFSMGWRSNNRATVHF
jgi:hypothetical protein